MDCPAPNRWAPLGVTPQNIPAARHGPSWVWKAPVQPCPPRPKPSPFLTNAGGSALRPAQLQVPREPGGRSGLSKERSVKKMCFYRRASASLRQTLVTGLPAGGPGPGLGTRGPRPPASSPLRQGTQHEPTASRGHAAGLAGHPHGLAEGPGRPRSPTSSGYGFGVEEPPASESGLRAQRRVPAARRGREQRLCLAAARTLCVLHVVLSGGLRGPLPCVHRCP